MTPAVRHLTRSGVPFRILEYDTDVMDEHDLGLTAARTLGLAEASVCKTLIVELAGGELVVALVPVGARLNLKQLARAAGTKSARMAERRDAERATGYLTGGISPIGQKKALRTFLAAEAAGLDTIHVSAGKRGLELALSPADLIETTRAVVCELTG